MLRNLRLELQFLPSIIAIKLDYPAVNKAGQLNYVVMLYVASHVLLTHPDPLEHSSKQITSYHITRQMHI